MCTQFFEINKEIIITAILHSNSSLNSSSVILIGILKNKYFIEANLLL